MLAHPFAIALLAVGVIAIVLVLLLIGGWPLVGQAILFILEALT